VDVNFLAGVVEGFYGKPWSEAERVELFDWMAAWGLDTYFYAPKDDLHHRALWREPYEARGLESLRDVSAACGRRGLRFVYGIAPGLDIRYRDASELERLFARVDQMLGAGCGHFALLFDDVPDRMDGEDRDRFGGLAPAQVHVANALFAWIRERRLDARCLFCPTAYCGRMAAGGLGGEGYLDAIGRGLHHQIDVLWTGPEIVSREVTVAHIRDVQAAVGRKPVIWDNLHANDYDGRRFYCGPYAGRPPALRQYIAGILTNPNNEFPLNYVPIRTLAEYLRVEGEWDPRQAWLGGMAEWRTRFETVTGPANADDLLLFGDCFYLPHEEGPAADRLQRRLRDVLWRPPAAWGDEAAALRSEMIGLRTLCARMADLRDRPLFHALSRRVWDLREELDLLDRYLEAKAADPEAVVRSDSHLPGTWRGGMVARLQALLAQRPDGTFVPQTAAVPTA
jgi:hypothetical protein